MNNTLHLIMHNTNMNMVFNAVHGGGGNIDDATLWLLFGGIGAFIVAFVIFLWWVEYE